MTNKRFAVVAGGAVTNILLWDGVTQAKPEDFPDGEIWTPFPQNLSGDLIEVSGDVRIGDSYADGAFSRPPVPVPAPTTSAEALAERSARLAHATREIDPLQDLVDLAESTDEDELKLIEWKQYRAAVGKVQTQPGFPGTVVWPEMPEL